MKYTTFVVGFRKPSGKEYRINIRAMSGTQAVRIASNRLSDILGIGNFYIIGEAEDVQGT
jgi:hypothetical protein